VEWIPGQARDDRVERKRRRKATASLLLVALQMDRPAVAALAADNRSVRR
jgi:hypothetical protein